jgi:hypothetical protein
MQLALDGAQLGVWSIDPITGRFENDARDRHIHGHHLEAPPKTLTEARTSVHPDDLPMLDAAFAASAQTGGSYKAEYRLAPVSSNAHADQERWAVDADHGDLGACCLRHGRAPCQRRSLKGQEQITGYRLYAGGQR